MVEAIPFPVTIRDEFERFWEAYPRKERWRSARDLFETLAVGSLAEAIIAGAKAYTAHIQREGIEYRHVQLPSTWLLEQGWRNTYELPKTALVPYDRRGALRKQARAGNRFSAEILKRDYDEAPAEELP